MQIDPKPECLLKFLFEFVWKIQPARPDHSHHDPKNWVDESRRARMVRTHCKICGNFIGYRDRKPAIQPATMHCPNETAGYDCGEKTASESRIP